MKQLVLSNWNIPMLPTIALLLFASIFLGVIWWVSRKESRELYKKIERLPLD